MKAILLVLVAALAAAPAAAAEPAHVGYPSSLLALGDSDTTGYNSGVPGRDAPANSWSTGTNPVVNSHYSRILAANPRIRGHAVSYAQDGAVAADLARQAQLPPKAPRPDYVTVELGGGDFCNLRAALDTPPALFRARVAAGLRAISVQAPNARIFVASVPFGPASYWDALAGIPEARAALDDGGPCAPLYDASGLPSPQRRAYVDGVFATYNGQLAAACAQFLHCRWDGGALTALESDASFFARDWGHPSIAGLAAMAAASWPATFDFTDRAAPVSKASAKRTKTGKRVTLTAAGARGIEYRIGKGRWMRYSTPVAVARGKALTWRAVDVNGNSEATHTLRG